MESTWAFLFLLIVLGFSVFVVIAVSKTGGPAAVKRMLAFLLVLLPVSVGAGLLGNYTVGREITGHGGDPGVGVGFGLTTFAVLVWFLFFSEGVQQPSPVFASVLVVCGTLCILVALALQFYMASLLGENSRRVAELLALKGGNVNLNVELPGALKANSYLALFAGIVFVAFGIRMAAGKGKTLLPSRLMDDVSSPRTASPYASPEAMETGIRRID